MLILWLPVVLLALATHLSISAASSSSAASSTSVSHRLPQHTRINGRFFDSRFLLPADVGPYIDDKNSWSKRPMHEEVLDSVLGIKPLAGIILDYNSFVSRSRQFAERLYAELWEGRIGPLCKELYDSAKDAVDEPHHFWDYLSGGAQPAAAFAHLLWAAKGKHPELSEALDDFARLASARVPQTAYFLAGYLDGRMPFPLQNISLDEWPQPLLDDQAHLAKGTRSIFKVVSRVHYYLMQNSVRGLAWYVHTLSLSRCDWREVFCILHAVEPALLPKFFDLGLADDSFTDKELFEVAAPPAMGMDPTLSSALIAVAKKNGWTEPVAEECDQQIEFGDDSEAGGTVHMQPLSPLAKSRGGTCCGSLFGASLTGKMIADQVGTRLLVTADNVLCAHSTCKEYYLHVCSIESAKVTTFNIDGALPVRVKVQHGDVIVMDYWGKGFPSLLERQLSCIGLSGEDRFEWTKSFFYAANNNFNFLAIVQSDNPAKGEDAKTFVGAAPGSRLDFEVRNGREGGVQEEERRAWQGQPSQQQRQACARNRNAERGQDQLQPS